MLEQLELLTVSNRCQCASCKPKPVLNPGSSTEGSESDSSDTEPEKPTEDPPPGAQLDSIPGGWPDPCGTLAARQERTYLTEFVRHVFKNASRFLLLLHSWLMQQQCLEPC